MNLTLYRKYRPQNFSQIIGQGHIIKTLTNALKNNRLSQAYLFTGPRGTGKTTVARILAKAVNCANLSSEGRVADKLSIRRSPAEADRNPKNNYEPCLKCTSCKNIQDGRLLDVIEIDAASHTGVDNIRQLKETVNLPPTSSKFKVYIIDEVHMLSIGAFNALLKTLEEPPAHVIFILATTAIHKVPETIISRCQRFDFTRLPIKNIVEKLSQIAKSEKVKISNESLEAIAIAAEGGMRDAESLLGQVITLEDKDITEKEVEEILGTTNYETVVKIASLVIKKDVSGAIEKINKLVESGYDIEVFAKSLTNCFRQIMLLKINPELVKTFSYELTKEQQEKISQMAGEIEMPRIIEIIELLEKAKNEISSSVFPQLPLEIVVIVSSGKLPNLESAAVPPTPKPKEDGRPETNRNDVKDIKTKDINLDEVESNWQTFVEKIKVYNHSLHAILAMSEPISAEKNIVTIAARYSFHKDKLESHKLTLEETFAKIIDSPVIFKFAVQKKTDKVKPEQRMPRPANKKSAKNSLLDEAAKLIGGKIIE